MEKKEAILQAAKTLFSEKGYKDTNISEITKMAGIAAGTFYLYFESKTQLFMELYLEENVKLKKQLMEKIDLDADPRMVIQQLMMLNLEGMAANPILSEWYNREVFDKIEQKYREEKGIDRMDFFYSLFIEVVRKWQAEGKMRNDIQSEMIMAMFTAIITVDTYKEEVGIQFFPEILDHLFGFLLDGLLINPGGNKQLEQQE